MWEVRAQPSNWSHQLSQRTTWSLIPESLLLRMWVWKIPELSVFLLNFSVTLSVETIAAKQPTLVGQVIVHWVVLGTLVMPAFVLAIPALTDPHKTTYLSLPRGQTVTCMGHSPKVTHILMIYRFLCFLTKKLDKNLIVVKLKQFIERALLGLEMGHQFLVFRSNGFFYMLIFAFFSLPYCCLLLDCNSQMLSAFVFFFLFMWPILPVQVDLSPIPSLCLSHKLFSGPTPIL